MPKDVCSPVSIKGSRVGSGAPMSPGAHTNPSSRRGDSEEAPLEQDARRSKKPAAGLTKIIGPEV